MNSFLVSNRNLHDAADVMWNKLRSPGSDPYPGPRPRYGEFSIIAGGMIIVINNLRRQNYAKFGHKDRWKEVYVG